MIGNCSWGSGISGGWAAKERLRGLKVLLFSTLVRNVEHIQDYRVRLFAMEVYLIVVFGRKRKNQLETIQTLRKRYVTQ